MESFNGIFDFTGFTGFNNNNLGHDNSSTVDDLFSTFNWENNTGLDLYTRQHADPSTQIDDWYLRSSNVGGPSQPYTGVEVLGDINVVPDLDDPARAPTTLHPASRVSLDEGRISPFYRGAAMSTPLPDPVTTSPLPAYSNPDGLGFDFLPAAGPSTLPAVHPILPYEESWGQIPLPGPSDFALFDADSLYPVIGATSPMIPSPTPVASSSGPQRTGKSAKGSRRYNPAKSAKKKDDDDEGEHEDGWDTTLVEFQTKLHDLVHNGQPPGGLSPEVALAAKIATTVKEVLKRSPLQDTRAGEGKRTRNVEDYLTGLLREIVPVKPASTPGQSGSNEGNMKWAAFARLADELEAKLVAVNQHPALRQPTNIPRIGRGARLEQTEDRAKKNGRERSKRDSERQHLERITHLFKVAHPQQTWTRVDVLSFAVVFLLCGPSAFSPGFVEAAPMA